MLFQGQELLEDRWFDDTVALDWSKAGTFKGILRLHRDLIALRRDRASGTRGLRGPGIAILRADDEAKLLVVHRWSEGGPGDDTVVIANFADRTIEDLAIGMPSSGRWRVRFNSDSPDYDPEFGGHEALDTDAEATGSTARPRAPSSPSGRTAWWSSPRTPTRGSPRTLPRRRRRRGLVPFGRRC